ncbi:DUF2441 domain-containing protein [Agrobacterium sp. DE0009]|uniref:DUF2441 domain-containing protein n=1 Tax=Agrobacterium sp. DE0009 TaxID=2587505 RepID=UPI00119E9E1D|nr:DUF2441 domain-containing protein [Agrobacterium sp. DE0009]
MTHLSSLFDCFHVTRDVPYSPKLPLEIGYTTTIGQNPNPFFNFYENARTYPVNLANGDIIQVPAIRFLKAVRSGEITPANLAGDALDIAQHYLMLARELLYEEVRVRDHADLPSRQTCLWASDNIEEARAWAVKLGGRARIFRLRVVGLKHRADANLLLGDSEPLSATYKSAEAYWSGESSSMPLWETLISGAVTLVDEVDMHA